VSARVLTLADDLAAAILLAAARAYPAECCGLIEGIPAKDGWRVAAVHEAKNIADDARRRFLIDPQAQFDLLRRLRGSGRQLIGCFHSHPDGRAEPSATDHMHAYESNFLYLIAAGSPESGFHLQCYVSDHESESFLNVKIAD
jgi:desampylase